MDDRINELRDFCREHDRELYRAVPFDVEEVRDSDAVGPGTYSIKGHAAVYDQWSLNLGGFRERIAPDAFDNVLAHDPHVLHTWDHDTSRALSSTKSGKYKLELESDKQGLRFYSRVAPTTYSKDLRTLLDGGVINQSSFAFTVKRDAWKISEDDDGAERVERTILEIEDLFDVTTCAMGAYPQTDSALALRSMTRSSAAQGGAEGEQAAPAERAAPDEPVDAPADEPAAHRDGDATATEHPEDRDAREREFELWRQKRLAQHRRTREFAFGVKPKEKEEER